MEKLFNHGVEINFLLGFHNNALFHTLGKDSTFKTKSNWNFSIRVGGLVPRGIIVQLKKSW